MWGRLRVGLWVVEVEHRRAESCSLCAWVPLGHKIINIRAELRLMHGPPAVSSGLAPSSPWGPALVPIHVRRSVGEVAVPYGACSEPSNVAANGQDCPVRFRCVGCGHFRTDISYLPDLESYLAELLRNRERLLAAADADDWAKAEAMPSDEEIRRVRRLIARIKADVGELPEEDRIQIQEAVDVVRRGRSRAVGLGMPRTRQPLPDVRPDRSA